MTRTRVNCTLVIWPQLRRSLFSHLGGSRPVGTRRCIVWLLHIAICATPDCSTLDCIMCNTSLQYVQHLVARHWKPLQLNISGSNEGRRLSTGTGKLQNANRPTSRVDQLPSSQGLRFIPFPSCTLVPWVWCQCLKVGTLHCVCYEHVRDGSCLILLPYNSITSLFEKANWI